MWLSRGSGAPHNENVYEAGITSCFTKDEFMLKWSDNVTFMWFVHLWVFIISLKEVVEAINECRTTPWTTGYSLTKTQRWTFKEQHLLGNIPEGWNQRVFRMSWNIHLVTTNVGSDFFKCLQTFRPTCTFPIFLAKHKKGKGGTRLFHSTLSNEEHRVCQTKLNMLS